MTERPVPSSAGVSARMSRHPRRDTGPELALRRLLHATGYRYRVSYPVPGLPRRSIDIAFTRAKVAVFIDGCFWHGCPDHGQVPTANNAWWIAKLDRNRERDVATAAHLAALGWTVLRLWEHTEPSRALDEVTAVLGPRDDAGGTTRRGQIRSTSSSSSS
jgi:DNA mismatch endonuclease (patch repair protein)